MIRTSTKWTIENLKEGLDAFYNIHKRYPTSFEVDKFELLPSSRQIQRRFGGLPKLRALLNLPQSDLDLTKGQRRSAVAKKAMERGTNFEQIVYKLLITKFGEIFVHAQKPFHNFEGRLDFFIYCQNYNFVVDVFFAENLRSLAGCVNIKQDTYKDVSDKIIFVSANPFIPQTKIDDYVSKKEKKLLPHISILTIEELKKFITTLTPHQVVTK